MESWSYFCEDKEYECENGSMNGGLISWQMWPSINNMECSNQKGIVEMESTEMMMTKFLPKNREKILYPPSSAFESSKRGSSLINLQLGRTLDHKESLTLNRNVSRNKVQSQTAFCQVQGCRKDLGSCKEYHKRHKVCEVHSKTSKVIVNGIEQRFCQQCSRFHVVAEFDNEKRSCRKRLAGHNQRRRKPHVAMNSSRDGHGSRFQGSTSKSSINRLTSKLIHQHKYKLDDWIKLVKVEHGDDMKYPKPLSIPHTSANQNFPLLEGMCSDIASSVAQEPNSGRALSLLSDTSSLVRTDGDSCYGSTTELMKVSNSSWIENSFHPASVFNAHYGDNLIVEGRDYSYLVSEGDPTINLFELSSQIFRVEQERKSREVKLKHET